MLGGFISYLYYTIDKICYSGAMVRLVGILNVTPDSFSDGGQFLKPERAIAQAEKLLEDGAAIVDVGAESTKPHAIALSDEQEWHRLESVLNVLLQEYPGMISLDSYHPETVTRAYRIGPVIVNDVTGFTNPEMVAVVIALRPQLIISHLPKMTIQQAHEQVPVTSVGQVRKDLLETAELLQKSGVPHGNIILDPGIGFGKTMELNKQLLTFAEQVPDYPVMIGYSRKRFLGENRMEIGPNLSAARIAIKYGASYLRVHDVAAHAQLLQQLL
jgi:dihydropteroate synthase